MQFSASPLGQLHQTLTDKYKGKCKPDKNLDDCELRADSQDSKDLRVKTGRLWGLSPKERNTHRLFAFPVVSKAFFSSVHSLVTDQKNLDPSVQSKTKGEAAGVWTSYVVPLRALTLGDLPRLYDRAVQLVKDNQLMNANTQPIIESDFLTPQRDPKAPTLPSSSSSSSSSTLASSSSSLAASLSSSAAVSSQLAGLTVSSSASASPVASASAQSRSQQVMGIAS